MTARAIRRILAAVAVLASALCVLAGGRPAVAEGDAPSVSVSATTQVTDGQAVTVTVRTTDSTPAFAAQASLCRGDVVYQPSTGTQPNVDFAADGPNCPGPSHPISSSSDTFVSDSNTLNNAPKPDGETFLYRLGSGVVEWNDVTKSPQAPTSLACDDTHHCALVVEVRFQPGGEQKQWKPFVFPIAYGNPDPIAGCGGPAAAALNTGGSDRMQDAWISWTLGACGLAGAKGAPTRASFVSEGDAVEQFSTGALDLAYTAGGYDKEMALVPAADSRRAAIAVPIALNAAVLAVGGGVKVDDSHKAPYKDLRLTAAEFAAMISGGARGVAQPSPNSTASSPRTYRDDMMERNAELQASGELFDSNSGFPVGAFADAQAFSWYATRFLDRSAPDAWRVPDLSTYGKDRGKDRGVDTALALATPSYADALSLLSGRPSLRKGLIGPGPNSSGGVWVLTDLETARALTLTPVRVQDRHGDFVAPTDETLRAALPSMVADEHGILVSDPLTNDAGAYPMTFVEYALVPAEPLLSDDCSPRAAAQKLLGDWLSYVTGAGQAALPPGLVALPEHLRSEAAVAVTKVGTAPPSGACATADSGVLAVLPTAGGAPAAAPQASDSSAPSPAARRLGSVTLDEGPTAGLAAEAAVLPTMGVADDVEALPIAELADIPPFGGRRPVGWASSALALVGILGLTSLALYATSRAR